jgi:DNA-binding NarL/FixJ family response regulator
MIPRAGAILLRSAPVGRSDTSRPERSISEGVPINHHADLAHIRCLLVDDNRAFLETAQAFLAGEGVMVTGAASSSAEALRQARALRPDLVLVDIGLGDENGFNLASRLAGNGAAVIMISSGAEADYADLIAESPAAGFLPKTELSAAGIQRILGQAWLACGRESQGSRDAGSPRRRRLSLPVTCRNH